MKQIKKHYQVFYLKYFRSPDDVHDLMDDIAEQQEVSDEITTALSSGIGHADDVDEVRDFFST